MIRRELLFVATCGVTFNIAYYPGRRKEGALAPPIYYSSNPGGIDVTRQHEVSEWVAAEKTRLRVVTGLA